MTVSREKVVETSTSDVTATVVADRSSRARSLVSTLETLEDDLEITATTDDARVLEGVKEGTIDCVVATDRIAGRTWLSLLEEVREHRPEVPFVLVETGAEIEVTDALEAGVTDCLEVPDSDEKAALLARRLRTYGEKSRNGRDLERFRSVFEHAPDAIVVHDDEGNYLEANRRACEMLGYDREELLEKRVHDIEVDFDIDDLEAFWRTCTPGEAITVEGRNRRADGTEFPVRVSIRRIEVDDRTQFVVAVRDVSELKDREAELEWSLDLLEKTEEIADAGGWEYDSRSGVMRWTDGTRRILAADPGIDPTLEDSLGYYHPDDRPRIEAHIERALEEGDAFDDTLRVIRDDGEVRWIRVRGEEEPREDGTTRLRGAIWDVTERQRREREVRTSNAKLQALATALPDVTLLLDEDGHYLEVFAGAEAESLLYAAPDELVGERTSDVLPTAQGEQLEEAISQAVETGEVKTVEYRLEVPAGKRWFEARIAPLEDRIEGERAVVAAVRDVTDRKETAEKLREREAYLTQAQDVAEFGSWYTDVWDGSIEWSRKVYDIFGVPDGEPITYERFLECVHPEDREYVDSEWQAALEGETYDIEHRIVVDGETKWVREKAEITFDDEGEPVDAVGIVQDVTDRKEYERTLEAQNERLEVFNRLVRHDLRNHLNVISGYATLVEDHVDRKGADAAERIRSATDELLSITEEIRKVNRLIGDDDRRPAQLSGLVTEAVDSTCSEGFGCACTVTVPDELWVEATEGLVVALEHVLENAIEHNDATQPEVTVSIAEESPAEYVDLEVADNGPGIPDLEYELLTGQRERSQLEHSSGLGLWTVNWIVTDAGGAVEFDTGEDGTVVTLRLPLADRSD